MTFTLLGAEVCFTIKVGSANFNFMEPRFIQSQTQKLILSPQIRQYLRLLQIPYAQLASEIEQELAENPILEEVQEDASEEISLSPAGDPPPKENQNREELRFEQTLDALNELDENFRDGSQGPPDLSRPEVEEAEKQKNYQESLLTPKQSLSDFLLWQIGFLDLSEVERKAAEEIIGNLSDDGYLETPLEEIAQACGVDAAGVEKILKAVQDLDPPGIAARNLQESLSNQLEKRGPEAELAKKLVEDHFPLLEKKQWAQIAKRAKVSFREVEQAARLIIHLDPKPGRTFYGEDAVAVAPDGAVSYNEEGNLVFEIREDGLPEIRINPYYRRLLKNSKLDEKSRLFLKEKLRAALDFVKALGQRKSTLYNITREIVNAQCEFFEKGFSHLKPLRLKDISSRLGIHESTVSRATQSKYLSTPYGTLPYKSFFSPKLDRVEGGVESQKSMMEKIRDLIQSEDPAKPLSDQEMTERLKQEGIKIARRTVAKYRVLLKILPSHLRKKK